MSNVVDFTKFKIDKEIERFDQLADEAEVIDDFSADFAFSVAGDVAIALSELDYDVMDNPKSILEILTLIEIIRAMVFRITSMEHPFHQVSESLFQEMFEEQGSDYEASMDAFLSEILD